MSLPTDEFMNDTSEVHAFLFGMFDGVRKISPRPKAEPESKKESHYYKFGYLVGTTLQALGLIVMAYVGSGML